MKKLLILLLVSVSIFAACGSGSADKNLVDGVNEETITGVLVKQSSDSQKLGTHLIMTESSDVYAVSSIAINLSDPKYLGNKVQVRGVFDADKQLLSITSISILEVLDPVSNDNKIELLEYNDSDFGIVMSYYSSWEYVLENTGLTFLSPVYPDSVNSKDSNMRDSVVISQEVFSYENNVFADENTDNPLRNYVLTNFPEIQSIENLIVEIGPDKIEAISLSNKKGGEDYYLYRNGLIYTISYYPYNSLVKSPFYNDFKKMLNSFKFIGFTVEDNLGIYNENELPNIDEPLVADIVSSNDENNITPDDINLKFTYFESLPYSFRGEYPASWYYQGTNGSGSIMHHYGFSDDVISDNNELVSLDVLSSSSDSGSSKIINGKNVTVSSSGDTVSYFLDFDSKVFKISGSKKYDDIMKIMISNFETVQNADV